MDLVFALTERQGDPGWWACLALIVGCPIFLGFRAWLSKPKPLPRIFDQVSEHERDLLGTDWFRAQNFIPNPSKEEGRVADTTGPQTIQGAHHGPNHR